MQSRHSSHNKHKDTQPLTRFKDAHDKCYRHALFGCHLNTSHFMWAYDVVCVVCTFVCDSELDIRLLISPFKKTHIENFFFSASDLCNES